MVLVERRLFALIHEIARTGQYPQQRYIDIEESDSEADYDLELALPEEPYRSNNPIHWIEGQLDEMIHSTVSRHSDLPAYPIMRYILSPDGCGDDGFGGGSGRDASGEDGGDALYDDEGPRTYEQALNLDLQYETDGQQTIKNALHFRDEQGGKRVRYWPTSKAPISVGFHSFRLILGRLIISRHGLKACMLILERARAERPR